MVDDPRVLERQNEIMAALGPALLPLSPGQPHITLWVQGFNAPPPHPQLQQRFPVSIGAVNSFLSCPFLEVRAPVLKTLRQHCVGLEERWAAYRPHLTLGRYAAALPTRELSAQLRPFRSLPPIHTTGTLRHLCVDAFSETGHLVEPC
jgi:hypothetical protein